MRQPRELQPGAKYHVRARANRGEFILKLKEIKELFLVTLKRAKKKFSFEIINFCIMDNHIHLIIRPGKKESLSKIMQWILSVFAINFNNKFNLKGHVWYDRFKSSIIGCIKQLIATFHYVTNNPIKAGIVKTATEYEYNGVTFIMNNDFTVMDDPPQDLWPH